MVMKSGKWKLCGAQSRQQEWRDATQPLYLLPVVAGANAVLCMMPWNKGLVPTVEVTQGSGGPGTHSLPSFITGIPASHLLRPPGTSVQEKPP